MQISRVLIVGAVVSVAAVTGAACAGGSASVQSARVPLLAQGSGEGSGAGVPAGSRSEMLPLLDSARLIGDISRLSHDSMAGRAPMTPESEKVRKWLASEFARIGLEPVAADPAGAGGLTGSGNSTGAGIGSGSAFEHAFVMPTRRSADSVRGVNVIAQVRGTQNPDRVIVVGAHYDHVGIRNGEIYNGADDNASGTAAVLAMAAHFKENPTPVTLIFALWDAEEMGLLGARAFVANPPVPLTSIIVNVNMDMISRNDNDELYAAGAYHYPQFRPLLEELATRSLVTLKLGHDSGGGSNDWTSQSDHGAFHAANVPFVYFGVEDHPDYHRPTDDFERIHQSFYYRAVRSISWFVQAVGVLEP